MAVVYAADLTVAERDSWLQPAVEDVIACVAAWAGLPEGSVEGQFPGRRRRSTVNASWLARSEGLTIWRLKFSHSDARDAALQWSADVDVIADGTTEVKVRLDRSRLDHTVGPPGDRPLPPGCIRSLVENQLIAVLDAGVELSTDATVVRRDDAEDFARLVLAPDRRLPIVAYTPRDEDIIDGQPLLRDLLGLAHIRLVLSEASWALNDLVPRGVNVYGGAVRVIWPGVTPGDPGPQHPMWYSDTPAQRVYGQVSGRVLTASIGQAVEDVRILEIERGRRHGEAESLRERLEELGNQLEYGQLAIEDVLGQLREAEGRVGDLAADRDLWADLATQYENQAIELGQSAARIEAERDHWRFAAEGALDSLRSRGVDVDDPVREFCAAVEQFVLSMGSVDGARRRPYEIGHQFLEKVAGLGPSYRDKVLRTSAAIVVNTPRLLDARDDHALRSGSGGNDPAVARARDGAKGRRIAIEQNTAAARRLHYWVLPDSSIELASVNVHDDMTIPE